MKVFFVLLFAILLLGCQNNFVKNIPLQKPPSFVSIGTQLFTVEVADNETKRQIGLMWRPSMPKNHGMIFLFDESSKPAFWMKNTLIPLDIIWISKDWKVVDFKTMYPCPPDSNQCPRARPKEESQYVLEVNKNIFTGKIGDPVVFVHK